MNYIADLNSIREAQERIKPYAHRTPVLTCATLDRLAGRQLFFKCENFQKVGAFKFRGACNAVMNLSDDVAKRGVVTHSSGNHAQALALAAAIRGINAHVVMPNNASAVKRRAVEGYGAKIYPCEPTEVARQMICDKVLAETGGTFIPPFDHPDIIAGQGTMALELLEQAQHLDAIIAPVGGGGMISGVAIAAKAIHPDIRIFAGEPAGADDAARSKAAGKLIPQTAPNTIADGLLTSPGEHTWPVVRDLVERVVTVSDDQIISAMRLIWERMKIIVEPSGAVAAAAVMTDEFKTLSGLERVGVIISGGNVDLEKWSW